MRLYKLHDYDMAAIDAEIQNIAIMTKDEPYLGYNIPALSIIQHNIPCTAPSIVLHGAENEHRTMDFGTFQPYWRGI